MALPTPTMTQEDFNRQIQQSVSKGFGSLGLESGDIFVTGRGNNLYSRSAYSVGDGKATAISGIDRPQSLSQLQKALPGINIKVIDPDQYFSTVERPLNNLVAGSRAFAQGFLPQAGVDIGNLVFGTDQIDAAKAIFATDQAKAAKANLESGASPFNATIPTGSVTPQEISKPTLNLPPSGTLDQTTALANSLPKNQVQVLGEQIGRDASVSGVNEAEIASEIAKFPGINRDVAIGNIVMRKGQGQGSGVLTSGTPIPSTAAGTQTGTGVSSPTSGPISLEGLEGERSNLINDLKAKTGELSTQGTRMLNEENRLGIPEMSKKLMDFDSQIAQAQAEYQMLESSGNQQINNLSSQPIEMRLIVGQQAQMKRQLNDEKNVLAAKIGALGVMREATMGNINTARQLVERTINLEFSQKEQEIKNLQLFLQLNESELDREEKKQAEKIRKTIDLQKYILDQQKSDRKENYELMIKVAENGGDPNIIDLKGNLDSNIQKAAPFLKDGDKDTVNFIQDLAKKGYRLAQGPLDLKGKSETDIFRMSDVVPGDKRIYIAPASSSKLLSVSEAKALGVPYGTTQEEAVTKGIIPKKSTGSGTASGVGFQPGELLKREYNSVLSGLKTLTQVDKNVKSQVQQKLVDLLTGKAFRPLTSSEAQFYQSKNKNTGSGGVDSILTTLGI